MVQRVIKSKKEKRKKEEERKNQTFIEILQKFVVICVPFDFSFVLLFIIMKFYERLVQRRGVEKISLKWALKIEFYREKRVEF